MATQEFENRRYVIFNMSEINKIDFNQVLETSSDTVRKSLDNTKTFVKWDGETPSFVSDLTTKEGPYIYDEIIPILLTSEWSEPSEI
jgi:hypothetical protein